MGCRTKSRRRYHNAGSPRPCKLWLSQDRNASTGKLKKKNWKRKRKTRECVKIWVSGARQNRRLWIANLRLMGGMLRHARLRRHSVLVATLLNIVLIRKSLRGVHRDIGHVVRWHMRVLGHARSARLGWQVGRRLFWRLNLVVIYTILVAWGGFGCV